MGYLEPCGITLRSFWYSSVPLVVLTTIRIFAIASDLGILRVSTQHAPVEIPSRFRSRLQSRGSPFSSTSSDVSIRAKLCILARLPLARFERARHLFTHARFERTHVNK